MELRGTVALVTGVGADNLGRHFAEELLERGARKVYAAARRPELVDLPGVQVLRLDLTDPASIAEAARTAADVELLVNNAGTLEAGEDLLTGDLERVRRLFDTNVLGTLRVMREFAPVLAAVDGGGGILNVLSAMAWSSFAGIDAYGASKAAAWSITNAVRRELAAQGTQVTGLVFGMAGTPPMLEYAAALAGGDEVEGVTPPRDIVRTALDGVEAGEVEVLADRLAVDAKAALAGPPRSVYDALVAG